MANISKEPRKAVHRDTVMRSWNHFPVLHDLYSTTISNPLKMFHVPLPTNIQQPHWRGVVQHSMAQSQQPDQPRLRCLFLFFVCIISVILILIINGLRPELHLSHRSHSKTRTHSESANLHQDQKSRSFFNFLLDCGTGFALGIHKFDFLVIFSSSSFGAKMCGTWTA